MLKIKVCGMTNYVNIGDVAKAGPDFLGYIFYAGSERFVGFNPDFSLFNAVPLEIIKTGVFVNDTIQNIERILNRYQLGAVQLHGNENPDFCHYFRTRGVITIKSFGIGDNFDFRKLSPFPGSCDYFLFDTLTTDHGGSGKKFRWKKLEEYKLDSPFILSGGIGPEDITAVKELQHTKLFAVDINSRFESSVGIKDAEGITEFINKIKDITV